MFYVLCEVNNFCKKLFDSVKTSQSQKGVRNMGILRYESEMLVFMNKPNQLVRIEQFLSTELWTRIFCFV
jgi:hypothetical protein